MMYQHILLVSFLFCVLTLVGLGPSLLLMSKGPNRVPYALGTAPAMGMGLLCFVAYPLFRYVGPSSSWALPLILVGGIASGIVVWQDYRRSAFDYAMVREPRIVLRNALYLLLVIIGLTAPSLVGGLEYLGS